MSFPEPYTLLETVSISIIWIVIMWHSCVYIQRRMYPNKIIREISQEIIQDDIQKFNRPVNQREKNTGIHPTRGFRVVDICPWCLNYSHTLRKCVEFTKLKLLTDSTSTVSSHLNPNNENGFCAAGILPYCKRDGKTYIMLARENRLNKTRKNYVVAYNFIGGGREAYSEYSYRKPFGGGTDCSSFYRMETSKETALAEFIEEITSLVSQESKLIGEVSTALLSCRKVFWDGRNKYVLYPVNVSPELMDEKPLTIGCEASDSEHLEAQSYDWIDIDEYAGGKYSKEYPLHYYIKDMLNRIGSLEEFTN